MSAYIDKIAKPPKTLTDLEQRLLLKVTGERRDGFRDHLIFSIALGTALREHEIVALNVGDVLRSNGAARRWVQLKVFKRSNPDADGQQVFLPDALRAKLTQFYGWKKRKGQDEIGRASCRERV